MKEVGARKSKKGQREIRVLMGLIDLFIETGRPVGSQTLQECGFETVSSATIRNYFARLEKEGFLTQGHSSGGRAPTEKAFRLYAEEKLQELKPLPRPLIKAPLKEIAIYLDNKAEELSKKAGGAIVISAPRFDHDFIRDMRLVSIDESRVLCALITDFGLVKTELLSIERPLDAHSLKTIESYFLWRLNSQDTQPPKLSEAEESVSLHLYHEIMVRYLVGYSHFVKLDLHKKGFSTLLSYPECSDPLSLAHILGLFEHEEALFALINESLKKEGISSFIGNDLNRFFPGSETASFIASPYLIHQRPVGAISLLGPIRMNYGKAFQLLQEASLEISEMLTKSLYTFKLNFREPSSKHCYLTESENKLLIENK
ncbi:MAG: heat-inducible transcriptional repressor HrcA [Chlamydiota bacterium]